MCATSPHSPQRAEDYFAKRLLDEVGGHGYHVVRGQRNCTTYYRVQNAKTFRVIMTYLYNDKAPLPDSVDVIELVDSISYKTGQRYEGMTSDPRVFETFVKDLKERMVAPDKPKKARG